MERLLLTKFGIYVPGYLSIISIHPSKDTDSFHLGRIINLIVASEIRMRILFPYCILPYPREETSLCKMHSASNFHGKHFQLLFRGVILALRDAE